MSNTVNLVFVCVSQKIEGGKITNIDNFVVLDKETGGFPSKEITNENGKDIADYYEELISDITEYAPDYFIPKLIECKIGKDGRSVDVFFAIALNITNFPGFNRLDYLNLHAYELVNVKEKSEKNNIDTEILNKSCNWAFTSNYGRNQSS